MAFKKGESGNTEGRPKGTPNKLTATVKEVFTTVFTDLQSESEVNLFDWAKKNPTDFYKLCAKLIPAAVEMKVPNAEDSLNYDEFIKNVNNA